jgi:hypothetical protein
MTKARPEPMLWLDDHRGQYIPQDFATSFSTRDKDVTGVSDENWAILEAGPDHEWYWDAWTEVCDNAVITANDGDGTKYTVHQDGACWLIPEGMEWSDKAEFFVWPDDDDEEVTSDNQQELDRDV